ncbi:MAG: hypothetical protein EU544_00510 [Promethearchaeota archaeon]|nr:MAG: hypothetical protein EU544_00510 [Candidatus Lokiarchaeota archaeon]
MRIRKRDNLKKKNCAIVLLFLLPLIGFGAYASFLLYILNDIASFTYHLEPPNTEHFTPEEDIDMDILSQQAHFYEAQLEKWHLPANISVDVTFKNHSYNEIDNWHGTDNGNLHVGFSLLAETHRYKWALKNNKEEELENATRTIKKLVTAFSNFIAAPNGGLGINPETGEWYPGTLSRFAVPPGYEDVHPFMFEDHPRHFNGTGDYKNWRVRLHTSRDELAGFYIGTACVLKHVDPNQDDESKWIWNRVKLIVSQLIEGFKRTNWLIIGAEGEGGEGTPCGSDLNAYGEGSTWQLALLRIGATADPDAYDSLYHYSATKMLGMGNAVMGSPQNVVESTYALSFGMAVEYSLILLEDNEDLRYHYIKNFEERFYDYVRYHRNNFYNMVHLVFMELIDSGKALQFEDPDYKDDTIAWDILDNLWRFYTSGWDKGVRNYNLTDRPHSTRSTSLNPEIREKERVPNKKKWRDFFENNPYGALYRWVYEEDLFDFSEEKEQYLLPLTVSEYGIHHWVWEHSKFNDEGGNPTGDGLSQAAPNSFLAIYWMGKAYNIF